MSRKTRRKKQGFNSLERQLVTAIFKRFPPKGRLAKAAFSLRRDGQELTKENLRREVQDDFLDSCSSWCKDYIGEVIFKELKSSVMSILEKAANEYTKGPGEVVDPDDKSNTTDWRDYGGES